ncbi:MULTISPECIES: GNAT family N-acetyltransferase [unclassified Streptomyces]|uniref:GNAT family N-acetyltransferase n=1 Tax=unclassified Streptomyces TaxID=2593676 RepID=UPI003634503F
MDHAPRVRALADADWPQVAALEAAAYAGSGLTEGQAALESRGRVSPGTCFVLDLGDRLGGYVLALPYPEAAFPDLTAPERAAHRTANLHLHDLVVDERLRGRGLGARLAGHLTAVAADRGFERMSLVAVAGLEGFWRGLGYRAHRDIEVPSGYGPHALYMSTRVPVRGPSYRKEAGR